MHDRSRIYVADTTRSIRLFFLLPFAACRDYMKTSNREVIVVTFNNERKNAKCIRAAFFVIESCVKFM